MQSDLLSRVNTFYFFRIVTASIFVLVSGIAQAQCMFFADFANNKDGTVTDTRNGLIWKRCAEGFNFSNGVCIGEGVEATWDDAMVMAQQSRFLDKDDWRLPTKEEFEAVMGVYDECKNNQNGEYAASKAIAHSSNINNGFFWTSSLFAGSSGRVWIVGFNDGIVGGEDSGGGNYLRLVRAGQVSGGGAAPEFVNEMRVIKEKVRAEASKLLKTMSKDEVCVAYGKALRDEVVDGIGLFPDITKLVKKELVRRKLRLDDSLVRKGKIKMGISDCQLYATWGMPEDQNRTVGSWGVHTQNVYGSGIYVYTENGRVTSWQD